MIEYKSAPGGGDSASSLTYLWEVIVRTKRLPEDLDPKALFVALRERLRNAEREVRQHALRVLADLIPVVHSDLLNKHLEFLLPELIMNLSHVAPSVRKGTIDVLRVYLKHSMNPGEVLKNLINVVPKESYLMQGVLMAIPYFSNYNLTDSTLLFLIEQLFDSSEQDLLRETSICSLVKTRSKIGAQKFHTLIGPKRNVEFETLCARHNIMFSTNENVILETEIKLEKGPAITMKIHEESDLYVSNEPITRSPRKVRFGGEVVKMRTPESDSNLNSSDDNDVRTSLVIDRPTSIKITVSDNIAAIKTRHKSLIPVRITASNPSSPSRKIHSRRLYKSAPDLGRLHTSKIPIKQTKPKKHETIEMFHNLTRTPEKLEDQDLESMEMVEKDCYPSFQLYKESVGLEGIMRDLSCKDDNLKKTRALDDLTTYLTKKDLSLDRNQTIKLFQILFQLGKEKKAQECLNLFLSRVDLEIINDLYSYLAERIIKVLPPVGIYLSLILMKRSSPQQFFEKLKFEENNRESVLQVLIAATRTFPSSEIDFKRGIKLSFEAMKDNKRGVRQAALEALASLAQVAGNSFILDVINRISNGDSDYLVSIVRTRLSRRQLPTVEGDGSVRYSSPREQEEFDWLCGGTPQNSTKYWKHNPRHELPVIVDETKPLNGVLCPVYVLHPHFDRGRSISPPRRNYYNGNKKFRKTEFRKSFSSEQIFTETVKISESTSFSLSSRSSTTSTGSSNKSGIWLRSGIPVPILADRRPHRGPTNRNLEPRILPPPSSGSESSGYFTPPIAENLKEDSIQQESFDEENNNFEEVNFQIVSEIQDFEEQTSISSAEASEKLEDVDEATKERYSPLDEVDFSQPRVFTEPRSKSRAECVKSILPEIPERKNINSAPPLNDNSVTILEPDIKISLPGSIASSDNTPVKSVEHSARRLERRNSGCLSLKKSGKSTKSLTSSRPKELLNQSLNQIESNDWEAIMKGLNTIIRLARHSPEVLDSQIHQICVALAKNIKNLRSQVARTACHASSEIFATCKRGLDTELEELAIPLLQRTADTNKFLRSDANAALDSMSLNLSLPKVVSVVTAKGSTHQNAIVRAASTRILSDIAMRLGPEKVFQLPKDIRDKFLLVGANGLSEGSLEIRKHAKSMMGTLVKQQHFNKALAEAVPQHTLRHISKVINNLK